MFEEQLSRWKAEPHLTPVQRRDIERAIGKMKRLREVNSAILTLADELKERTIEKMLAKSDLEIGLETLQRELKRKPNRSKD